MRQFGETLARQIALTTDTIQWGTSTLSAGVTPAIPANVTATSVIWGIRRDAAGTMGVELCAKDADKVVGAPGSFKITSIASDKSTAASDTSTIYWLVIG